MSIVLYVAAGCTFLFAGFVGVTSVVTDIQLGLVAQALIGGFMLMGLGAVLDRLRG